MAVKKQPAKPERRAKPRAVPLPVAEPRPDDGEGDNVTRRIAEAAYYRAQQRGFEPGHELEDWIAAEQEVRRRMEGAA
ncbi:MAG: hypothetical protein QOD26_3234 [Betaproteobacteria bacterium]|jgi:hypothetical protein|nr:hypothetical protein [Betaproteobacteria bacterium]